MPGSRSAVNRLIPSVDATATTRVDRATTGIQRLSTSQPSNVGGPHARTPLEIRREQAKRRASVQQQPSPVKYIITLVRAAGELEASRHLLLSVLSLTMPRSLNSDPRLSAAFGGDNPTFHLICDPNLYRHEIESRGLVVVA